MLGDRLVGGDRLRAGAERRLVRRQLEHLGDAGRRTLARYIGVDGEHAGTGLRTLQDGHVGLRIRGWSAPAAPLAPPPYSGLRGCRREWRRAPKRQLSPACR